MTPTPKTARRSLFAAFAVCAAGGATVAAPGWSVGSVSNRRTGSVCGQRGRADRRVGGHVDR